MTLVEQNSNHRSGGRTSPLDGLAGRLWRVLWTALSFALFGLGALLFGLIYFPLLWVLVRHQERRERFARASISRAFGWFIGFMGLFVLSWECRGLPPRLSGGGLVVVANHPTLIDAVFLMWLLPGADCVVKASHWRNPLLMFAVRAAGYIPNNNDEHLLETGIERVRQGRCLLLFPQGTRSRPGEEPVFRRGGAIIAARGNVPLLPVHINCSPPTLRKGEAWLRVPQRRGHFRITALDAMEVSDWTADDIGERAGTRALTDRLSVLLLEGVN